MDLLLYFIGTIAIVFGVKFIFDARPIVKKYFGTDDKNDATIGLKIIGFLLSMFGALLIVMTF